MQSSQLGMITIWPNNLLQCYANYLFGKILLDRSEMNIPVMWALHFVHNV